MQITIIKAIAREAYMT